MPDTRPRRGSGATTLSNGWYCVSLKANVAIPATISATRIEPTPPRSQVATTLGRVKATRIWA
jgi:hypothetical protein